MEGEVAVGRDEPEDVAGAENFVAAGVDNFLSATLDGDDDGALLGERGVAYFDATEGAVCFDMVAVHVELVVGVVVDEDVGLHFDDGSDFGHFLFGAYDGKDVAGHEDVVFVGEVDEVAGALNGDDVGTVALAQLSFGEGLSRQGRVLRHL